MQEYINRHQKPDDQQTEAAETGNGIAVSAQHSTPALTSRPLPEIPKESDPSWQERPLPTFKVTQTSSTSFRISVNSNAEKFNDKSNASLEQDNFPHIASPPDRIANSSSWLTTAAERNDDSTSSFNITEQIPGFQRETDKLLGLLPPQLRQQLEDVRRIKWKGFKYICTSVEQGSAAIKADEASLNAKIQKFQLESDEIKSMKHKIQELTKLENYKKDAVAAFDKEIKEKEEIIRQVDLFNVKMLEEFAAEFSPYKKFCIN